MMGTKRRASRDMARMDGKHFSLDSVLTVLSFLIPSYEKLTLSGEWDWENHTVIR